MQNLVRHFTQLDRTALSVQAILSWDYTGPERVSGATMNRPADFRARYGQMWLESLGRFVKVSGKKDKERVASYNLRYREDRYHKSLRGRPAVR